MSQDQFRKAEEEYLRLRGQFEVGRIPQREFDDAVKKLMVQDAQGRYWSLGPDTGKWYVHDGAQWTQADPFARAAPPPVSAASSSSRALPIALIAIGVLFVCLIAAGGILWMMSSGAVNISLGAATATRVALPPLPPIALATNTAVVPPSPAATLAAIPPTDTPTSIPPTATITVTPTLTATATMTVTPTLAATASPTIPPGFFVTEIRPEPNPPARQQGVGFNVTFLNNTSAPQSYRWLVYIYRVENSRNSFGETAAQGSTMPVGTTAVKTLNDWRTGIGPCDNYFARAAWIDENRKSIPFNGINGQPFEYYFQVC